MTSEVGTIEPTADEINVVLEIAEKFDLIDELQIHPGLCRAAHALLSAFSGRSKFPNNNDIENEIEKRHYPFQFAGSINCAEMDVPGITNDLFQLPRFSDTFDPTNEIIYIGVVPEKSRNTMDYAVTLGSRIFNTETFVAELTLHLGKPSQFNSDFGDGKDYRMFTQLLHPTLDLHTYLVLSLRFEGFPIVDDIAKSTEIRNSFPRIQPAK
jgi:hypothetical protein